MPIAPMCRNCRNFTDSAAAVEAAMPGLSSLGSAYAAVRLGDGICGVHERYVAAACVCGSHSTRFHPVPHSADTSIRPS
jgi:hypothetical protein